VSPESPVVAATYWERRAREFAARDRGLPAVCSYGMPGFYNRYIDICQRRALLPLLSGSTPGSALDVGCGVGRWSLELAKRGHAVTGLDLSPHMIEVARQGAGGLRASFAVGDAVSMNLGRTFDLILCVTVLQHILDPALARIAMQRLASHLSPGGQLILLEAAPPRRTNRCDTHVFRARPLEWYREALSAVGLSVVAKRGVDPMPFKTWLLPHYKRLPVSIGNLALALTTALTLPLDWTLGNRLSHWSWHQVLVARRPESLTTPLGRGA
jgi:2-polyprenyl-3-methyl-5-hydroxy-6-metoxy-1,4-benzoquinol methylase